MCYILHGENFEACLTRLYSFVVLYSVLSLHVFENKLAWLLRVNRLYLTDKILFNILLVLTSRDDTVFVSDAAPARS